LSRYSNKIESESENDLIITVLLRKCCHNNKHFSELAPHHGGKQIASLAWVWYEEITSLSPCRAFTGDYCYFKVNFN